MQKILDDFEIEYNNMTQSDYLKILKKNFNNDYEKYLKKIPFKNDYFKYINDFKK